VRALLARFHWLAWVTESLGEGQGDESVGAGVGLAGWSRGGEVSLVLR